MPELPEQAPLPSDGVPELDGFARAVRADLGVPVALVSLVDGFGQVFPGQSGLPEPWAAERCTPLSHSFCQHVVTRAEPLVVANAHDDVLVRDNLAVMDLGVVAYAGMPLRVDRRVVGALCAIDHMPRQWTPDELGRLELLAAQCSAALQVLVRR